jgi:ribonuclease Z
MDAYRVLLTHFSQRYPKLPVLTGASAERVVVAFDLMQIDMADLPHLPAALPVLVQMCTDDDADDGL